jgi:hypothetical protein
MIYILYFRLGFVKYQRDYTNNSGWNVANKWYNS